MMDSSPDVMKSALHDWVFEETKLVDIVASWESLQDTYDMLGFTDELSDADRMEEYKWIIKEMNKHLSRARKTLLTCRDLDAMKQALMDMMTSTTQTVSGRPDLTYRKLKQRWVGQMLSKVTTMMEQEKEEMVDAEEY